VVTKTKQEDFKDLQSLQENITKKHKCDDGTPLHFLEATACKFNNEEPSKMQVQLKDIMALMAYILAAYQKY
jgi:hypothetical protein